MTWNYRIIKNYHKIVENFKNNYINLFGEEEFNKVYPNGESSYYGIHEVIYGPKGNIEGWTEDPIKIDAETVKDLKVEYDYIKEAFNKPIIDLKVEEKRLEKNRKRREQRNKNKPNKRIKKL